jgi:Homeodomain-like domain
MPYRQSTPKADAAVAAVLEALTPLPAGDVLLALRSLAVLVGTRRAAAVLAARSEGMSWQNIADRLGMSRQSVWDRYGAEDVNPPRPARGRRSRARVATHTLSSCASYKAVTSHPR